MKDMRSISKLKSFFTLSTILLFFVVSANAITFVVNTTADTQDAAAGNGVCADAGGACSLRAAISEANALAGADVITLPAGTYTITLVICRMIMQNAGGDFDLNTEITINGAGSGTTIVQAAASTRCGNRTCFSSESNRCCNVNQ